MTGPTRAPATLAADLAALSEQAAPGEWSERRGYVGAHRATFLGIPGQDGIRMRASDVAYVSALVNAHRAGHLVTLDAALDWVAEQLMAFDPLNHDAHAAFAALRDRAAPRAPQPDTTHDTGEQP